MGDAGFRVVVRFNDAEAEREGWQSWLTVSAGTLEDARELLTMAWGGADDTPARLIEKLEDRVDERLSLDERGLNAVADIREGRHAKGNVLRLLKAELAAALKGADVVETRAVARNLRARISRRPPPIVPLAAAGVQIKAPLPAEISPARHASLVAATLEEGLPAELTQLIGGFTDYLRLQAGVAGLQRSEVVAFVQERLREHYADRESLLKARSPVTAALAGLEHATLMFGLAVAYGAEVMASGFAFEDMISANWLNWPLGFASAFLFGGGLMVITKGKEKTFWSAVAALWVVSVAIVATRNDTLVDPAHIKIGIERQDIKEKWNRLAGRRAELADLDSRLARKDAGLERDKERTGGSAKYRSAVMAQSADAVKAVEAERNAVFKAVNTAEKEWNGDKRNDPSRWKAALVVFIWTSVLNVAAGLVHLEICQHPARCA